MSLRINDIAPNFTAQTTHGQISFHDWIGDSWAILFSHPKDFTPVCTTELGYMAGIEERFKERNCKLIGLSIDPVENHSRWAADIEETQTGLLVTIRRSKTDQEAMGRTIAITRGDVACPVKALREWLNAAGIVSGSLFRPINKSGTVAASRLTDRSVANIVKEYANRASFDAAIFSAHSLRSGFLTSAAAQGASIFKMMDQSGHKSIDTLRLHPRCRTIQGSRGVGLHQQADAVRCSGRAIGDFSCSRPRP